MRRNLDSEPRTQSLILYFVVLGLKTQNFGDLQVSSPLGVKANPDGEIVSATCNQDFRVLFTILGLLGGVHL